MLYTDGEGDNETELQYPCQICCFILIGLLDPQRKDHLVDGQAITEGPHFIGQCFKEEPRTITSPVTKLIQRGQLENQLRLYHVDSIVSNVAVVPEFNYDGGLHPTEDYLVIQNRIQWLDYFYNFNRSNGAKFYRQLFSAYACANDDEAFGNDGSNSSDSTDNSSEEQSSDIETGSEESEEDTDDLDSSETTTTDNDESSGEYQVKK